MGARDHRARGPPRMSAKPELYLSTDIETNGPIPGPYSMLSFASVAYTPAGVEVGEFTRNLRTLDGAGEDPGTMSWWASKPDAWAAHRADTVAPGRAMREYRDWINRICREHRSVPVFVAYPAGFDFTFIYWYAVRFTGKSPFS